MVGTKKYVGSGVADTPLIVFINAKSGGRVGPRLLTVLFRSLGSAQVVRGGGGAGGCVHVGGTWASGGFVHAEQQRPLHACRLRRLLGC